MTHTCLQQLCCLCIGFFALYGCCVSITASLLLCWSTHIIPWLWAGARGICCVLSVQKNTDGWFPMRFPKTMPALAAIMHQTGLQYEECFLVNVLNELYRSHETTVCITLQVALHCALVLCGAVNNYEFGSEHASSCAVLLDMHMSLPWCVLISLVACIHVGCRQQYYHNCCLLPYTNLMMSRVPSPSFNTAAGWQLTAPHCFLLGGYIY